LEEGGAQETAAQDINGWRQVVGGLCSTRSDNGGVIHIHVSQSEIVSISNSKVQRNVGRYYMPVN